jgi:hypothetical protein
MMWNQLTSAGGYELGKSYKCSYWGEVFTVVAVHGPSGWMDWSVSVKWHSGRETTHSTPRTDKDIEVTL